MTILVMIEATNKVIWNTKWNYYFSYDVEEIKIFKITFRINYIDLL